MHALSNFSIMASYSVLNVFAASVAIGAGLPATVDPLKAVPFMINLDHDSDKLTTMLTYKFTQGASRQVDAESDAGAAWDEAPVHDILLHDLDRCDFLRVEVEDAKSLEACKEAGGDCLGLGADWASKPWIFSGISDNAHLRKNGPSSVGKAGMIRHWGDREVVVTNKIPSFHDRKIKTFADYVADDMKTDLTAQNSSDSWYLCGDNYWDGLLGAYDRPSILGGKDGAVTFGIGGSATGVPLHKHGAAFSETAFGLKRWFLAPPSSNVRFEPGQSTFDWFRSHVAEGSFPEDIQMCSQKPGEVLYTPEGWWHATLNVGETVFFLDFLQKQKNTSQAPELSSFAL